MFKAEHIEEKLLKFFDLNQNYVLTRLFEIGLFDKLQLRAFWSLYTNLQTQCS